ncbi:MAG: DUF559 domain-containing protein [Candidatus Marinimicrobia bacterium]|nr:DUF559 domain-containing protein [Candidatus Neomarinimicrobiota bacterium]
MKKILPYRPDLKEKAQKLRQNSTLSEVLLWNHLKQKQMYGYRFHRQKPILDYIVDFYAPELMLAIEIDGSSHNESVAHDRKREKAIEKLGVRFLRFQDRDIQYRINEVLITIQEWIEAHERANEQEQNPPLPG